MKIKKNYIREFRVKKTTLANNEHYFEVQWRSFGMFKWIWRTHEYKFEKLEQAIEAIERTTKSDNSQYKVKTEFLELEQERL